VDEPGTPQDHRVVLLVAHGSRNPAAQAAHAALVDALAAATDATVRPAYLEMAEPSIPDAIDHAVDAGATHLRVLPCFLHPGNHVLVDIPALVEAARERHRGARIDLLGHLGADPSLVGLLADQLSG
jgi:sirohydrochlorin ferrochelatase